MTAGRADICRAAPRMRNGHLSLQRTSRKQEKISPASWLKTNKNNEMVIESENCKNGSTAVVLIIIDNVYIIKN